jgi:hypothetical protein
MSEDLTRSTIVRDGLPDGEAVAVCGGLHPATTGR